MSRKSQPAADRSGGQTERSPAPAAASATSASANLRNADEPRVKINHQHMKSSYSNVCNVSSTREEVVLNFGMNHSWDRQDSELEIELHHRIAMSPHAAARLHQMIGTMLEQYRDRYGLPDERSES